MKPWDRISVAIVVFIFILGLSNPLQSKDNSAWYENLSKENKVFLLNSAAGAAILTWGVLAWDYGEQSPHFQSEGYLGRGTTEGGADKFGHAYFGYALSHLFYYQYKRWGYDQDQAIQFGCLSSLGITTLMEIGDSFSKFGFSYQDGMFNLLGVAIGYGMVRYPELARRIDFRVEYDPFRKGKYKSDISTDYNRLKYIIAVKMDGFDAVKDSYLKYFELQTGYYARGYDEYNVDTGENDSRRRKIYVGIGLNIGKLLEPFWETRIFNYVHVPYTYAPLNIRLDQ